MIVDAPTWRNHHPGASPLTEKLMKFELIIATLFALTFALVAVGGAHPSAADPNMCVDAQPAASFLNPEQSPVPVETRCWKCGDRSTGACSGGDKHCYGERSDCRKKGCQITGSTSECSSSKTTC